MIPQTLKPYVIGLDLGGTNSVFGIVDSRGDIKATTAIKTQAYDNVEDYVKASIEALNIIIDQVGGIENIKAMGIGAPNANYYNGTIENAANLEWKGIVPVEEKLKRFFPNIPVSVSLNEYVDIAKVYSTPKSGSFVNGTLDGIVNQLKKDGKLIKN